MNFIMRENILENRLETVLFLSILFGVGIIIYIYWINWRNKKHYANLSLIAAHYREIIDNNQDIMCLVLLNPQFHFEYINPSITSLTGYSLQDFYASPELFKSLIHPEDLPCLESVLKNTGATRAGQLFSFRLTKPDKTFVKLEAKLISGSEQNKICTGFYIAAPKPLPHSGLLQDVSYLERLSAISQMASSVAHEIRNPMTTVRGYLQFFSEKNEFVKYKEQFDLIINELDRTNLIIKEYLALNQNKLSAPRLCQLNNIIYSLYPLLKADANNTGKDIKIYLGNIPELLLEENKIRQLILNMVKNGFESMTDMKDRTFVNISTYLEGDKAVMSVKDQGPGISPNILADIGKPYLTTKEQGTGLGLAVCYQIAANHNAQIKIKTSHNGTDFFVKFSLPETFEQNESAYDVFENQRETVSISRNIFS